MRRQGLLHSRLTLTLKPWHSPVLLWSLTPKTPFPQIIPASPSLLLALAPANTTMPTLICDCNQTMPLQPRTLGAALDENLTLHSVLCRREAGAFQKAIQSGEDVVVACTQEKRLFAELAQQTDGASSVIKFVNIRETGGWSQDAASASPKIAALLAMAHLPDAEPVPTVTYKSAGRLLIIGELDAAERAAGLLSDTLDVTLFSLGAGQSGGAQERRYPVLA